MPKSRFFLQICLLTDIHVPREAIGPVFLRKPLAFVFPNESCIIMHGSKVGGQVVRSHPLKNQVAIGFLLNSRAGPIASRGMPVRHSVKYADY